ncbi:hypothetical protein [Kitasatospora phosalacinea]|uniref:Uncharacterized protein n=1 Tax=Kitasatospora phosalacinea TaxID=2065 RepID=A0A9W6UNB4_9ACTN|nr:hypothetical protein [Kitasatospora phosalacinea]GLW53967.1 hypothetical protein Kpho01_19780 [Kitasatospora phosalacinea]
MAYAITSPTSGEHRSVAGVHFADGHATVDELSAGARLYFQRHGYTVEQLDDPAATAPPAPAKGRGTGTK